MSNEQENEVVALRMPGELVERAKREMRGSYSNFSEYLRDLVRRDLERRDEAERVNKGDAA